MSPDPSTPPPGRRAPVAELIQRGARALRDAVDAIPAELKQFLTDPERQSEVRAQLERFGEWARREEKDYDRDPYAFLYDRMLAGPVFGLRLLESEERDELMLDALEAAFDAELVAKASDAMHLAPYLSPAQRERLVAGLAALRAPGEHWTEPCDRLLIGLDGTLWATAEGTGVVDEHGHLLEHERQIHVKGPNRLIEDESGLRLSRRLQRLISERLFDRGGHRARHGRAEEGHRTYALLAAAALLGWLDTFAETKLLGELVNRLDDWTGTYLEARSREE